MVRRTTLGLLDCLCLCELSLTLPRGERTSNAACNTRPDTQRNDTNNEVRYPYISFLARNLLGCLNATIFKHFTALPFVMCSGYYMEIVRLPCCARRVCDIGD